MLKEQQVVKGCKSVHLLHSDCVHYVKSAHLPQAPCVYCVVCTTHTRLLKMQHNNLISLILCCYNTTKKRGNFLSVLCIIHALQVPMRVLAVMSCGISGNRHLKAGWICLVLHRTQAENYIILWMPACFSSLWLLISGVICLLASQFITTLHLFFYVKLSQCSGFLPSETLLWQHYTFPDFSNDFSELGFWINATFFEHQCIHQFGPDHWPNWSTSSYCTKAKTVTSRI